MDGSFIRHSQLIVVGLVVVQGSVHLGKPNSNLGQGLNFLEGIHIFGSGRYLGKPNSNLRQGLNFWKVYIYLDQVDRYLEGSSYLTG